ncbi:MAG: serine/threonine-protein kinase, partial [Myxococcota bacterium]
MTDDQQELVPGTVVSNSYEIIRKIARGGMGDVYEAQHMRLSQRRVAIKVLRQETVEKTSQASTRFRREAEICAKLTHPNIVSVTDWNTLPDGRPFFVMEYLEGESLEARMARRRLMTDEIEKVLRQVGSAVHTAHQLDIVHRDLKPSNIFLVSSAQAPLGPEFVKVLDFGISKIVGANTLQTTGIKVLGSPRYMSPEQARGRNEEITTKSDQFTLAVVAYELYAGKPPFEADTVDSLLFNIVYEEPPPLQDMAPEMPRHVVDAINCAMTKAPQDRYPSMRNFLRDLLQDDVYLGVSSRSSEAPTLQVGAGLSHTTLRRVAGLMKTVLPMVVIGIAGVLLATLALDTGDEPSGQ